MEGEEYDPRNAGTAISHRQLKRLTPIFSTMVSESPGSARQTRMKQVRRVVLVRLKVSLLPKVACKK